MYPHLNQSPSQIFLHLFRLNRTQQQQQCYKLKREIKDLTKLLKNIKNCIKKVVENRYNQRFVHNSSDI